MSIDSSGHDSNQLDGNNSFQLLSKVDNLRKAKLAGSDAPAEAELLLPAIAAPILATMDALLAVVKGTMGHGLDPAYKELIAKYKSCLQVWP